MRRVVLVLLGLLLVASVFTVPKISVHAASAGRFEYLHLTPGLPQFDPATAAPLVTASPTRQGYQACVASRSPGEKCREFEHADSQERALDVALSTLGNDGWELVGVIDQTQNQSSPKGLTYIFKRQVQ